MGILDLFKPKEESTPARIYELAVFSLGSELDLYRLSKHLGTVFGTPSWERFAGRRSVVFGLDEGLLAEEVPYKFTARLFEDGGGFVRLDLDLSQHKFDLDVGPLWRRRELSSALTRFLEAALSTRDPEGLKYAQGTDASLPRLGIVPERIAGELDFGFCTGSILVKIGVIPKQGFRLASDPAVALLDGVFYMESDDAETLGEIERWAYREGAASWHRLSLRRWLERMDDVRDSTHAGHVKDFARFLRRVNHFVIRERRFTSSRLPAAMLDAGSEFSMLAADFDPTSKRLMELFSVRQEDAVDATLSELKRLSGRQERLFAAWLVLAVVGGLLLGCLYLLFPGASWLWMIGAGAMIVFPLLTYYLWRFVRPKAKPHPGRLKRVADLARQRESLENTLEQVERDKGIPDDYREELLTRTQREISRLKRLEQEEGREFQDTLH